MTDVVDAGHWLDRCCGTQHHIGAVFGTCSPAFENNYMTTIKKGIYNVSQPFLLQGIYCQIETLQANERSRYLNTTQLNTRNI